MHLREWALLFFSALAVVVLLASDYVLLGMQARSSRDIETVKSQLAQSKSGLVSVPAADYRLAVAFSLSALAIGAAFGYWVRSVTHGEARKKKPG